MGSLLKRYGCYYDATGHYTCNDSHWHSWGRWILLGIIIFIFLLFLFALWFTAYRRRRRGARPLYGTGWMASNIPPSQSYPQNSYNRPPPPPPGQQSYGYGYAQGPRQESGVYGAPREPAPAHTSIKEQYVPPAGPPPSRY